MYDGFEPIYDCDSKVLILGSFPSVKSRKASFYYGNPQNKFWKTMSNVFGIEIGDEIDDKKDFLLKYNIALWDIVIRCNIKGSADKDITDIEVADIARITDSAKIVKIICNGKKAYEIFMRKYPRLAEIAVCLPSTSPANTRYDYKQWRDELSFLNK